MNEKRKKMPRRLSYILLPALLIALIALLSLFFLHKNDAELDIFFLHQEENQTMQVYAMNLDVKKLADAQPVQITRAETTVGRFDVRGDWLVYTESEDNAENPEAAKILLLNWRSGESQTLLDCAIYEMDCLWSSLHFSADTEKIFIETRNPYPPVVWMLDRNGGEPEIVTQQDGINDVRWLSDSYFFYDYQDFDHNQQYVLYDIDIQTAQDFRQIRQIYNGDFVLITPDNHYLVLLTGIMTASDELAYILINLEDKSARTYNIPREIDALFPAWHPYQAAFLYRSGNQDGITLYYLETQKQQIIWTGNSFISLMSWSPDASRILFGFSAQNASQTNELELWLYDMAKQEALPLPVLGYSVQWLK